MVRRFLDDYRSSPNGNGKIPSTYTTKGYAQVIRGFFAWCDREGLSPDVISKRVKLPRVESKVIEIFTPDQLKRLMAACNREPYSTLRFRGRAMLAMFLGTGIRASELCTLTLDRLMIDSRDPRNSYIKVKGKGRKEREVGLPASTVEHINHYLRRYRRPESIDEHVFIGRRRNPLTTSGLDQWM